MRNFKLVVAFSFSIALTFAPARAEPVALDVNCLCKRGDKATDYFGKVALTPGNRDAMKALIESGGVKLGQQLTLKGAGCNAATFPPGWKDKCGDTSVVNWVTATKAERTIVPNAEFSGEVTIRVSSNSGIPLAMDSTDAAVKLDEQRWPQAGTFSVMGQDVTTLKTPPKKGKK
ncbi:MAG: hypothetical protein JNM89_02425 [Hyphomicrobiaceae bacterium]|nr:hypothetical protein [Hyphomicrobiaceae bacterium]